MLKTMIIAGAATLLSVGSAWAQSTTYYGANNQAVGRAQTFGGSTTYYGANNQIIGRARRY